MDIIYIYLQTGFTSGNTQTANILLDVLQKNAELLLMWRHFVVVAHSGCQHFLRWHISTCSPPCQKMFYKF